MKSSTYANGFLYAFITLGCVGCGSDDTKTVEPWSFDPDVSIIRQVGFNFSDPRLGDAYDLARANAPNIPSAGVCTSTWQTRRDSSDWSYETEVKTYGRFGMESAKFYSGVELTQEMLRYDTSILYNDNGLMRRAIKRVIYDGRWYESSTTYTWNEQNLFTGYETDYEHYNEWINERKIYRFTYGDGRVSSKYSGCIEGCGQFQGGELELDFSLTSDGGLQLARSQNNRDCLSIYWDADDNLLSRTVSGFSCRLPISDETRVNEAGETVRTWQYASHTGVVIDTVTARYGLQGHLVEHTLRHRHPDGLSTRDLVNTTYTWMLGEACAGVTAYSPSLSMIPYKLNMLQR